MMPSSFSRAFAALVLSAALTHTPAYAQSPSATTQTPDTPANEKQDNRVHRAALFVAGGAVALVAHEAGHLTFDIAFDADPRFQRVEFHNIPFFALTHRKTLSPRREAIVSSAGFWVQHATNEWLLTKRPNLRGERAPFTKGVLAFNVLTSMAYSGAAFAKTGPFERDTRGISDAARVDERWVGAIVLAPAVLDSWRYFDPESRAAVWLSRGAKLGMLVLAVR